MLTRRKIDDRVLVSYGGSGLLYPYHIGVHLYLKYNFDLTDVRVSGISGAGFAVIGHMIDIHDDLALEMIIRGWDMVRLRKYGPFLMNASSFANKMAMNLRSGGYQNMDIARTNKQYFFGVTSLCGFLPHLVALDLDDVRTIEELFYLLTCTMRILPFFFAPGFYKNHILLDGGFSAGYAIPEDQDPSKTISVSPWSFMSPDIGPGELFNPLLFAYPAHWDTWKKWGKRGWEDTERVHNFLVEKGLKPYPKALRNWEECEESWNRVTSLMKRGRHSFSMRSDSSHFRLAQMDTPRIKNIGGGSYRRVHTL